jgi:hypothetical protein
MEYPGSWDKNLPWAEFLYNNSYQESLKMAPFEALYGYWCRTPLNWIELGEKAIFGPNRLETVKVTVSRIQENIRVARSRQESYANKRHRPLEFSVGDHVYLKDSPHEGHEKIWNERKTSTSLHWTISHPLEMWERGIQVGTTIVVGRSSRYLPRVTAKEVFKRTMDFVLPEVAPHEADLTYPEYPVKILDQKNHVTQHKSIKFFKVQWSNHTKEEATWESKDFLRSRHLNFA